jgi:MFS family permease
MVAGAILSASGAALLLGAESEVHILLFGGLMSIGSAAFAGANWALTADLAPPAEAGRFMGLANFGTAGAVAAAGLLGPLIDGINLARPGLGYPALFAASASLFLASALALRKVSAPDAPPALAPNILKGVGDATSHADR